MVQEIIVLTIVFGAVIYAVWATLRSVRKKSSGVCGDNCACSSKSDIKRAILNKQKNNNTNKLKVIR
jgi:hypothetical protein